MKSSIPRSYFLAALAIASLAVAFLVFRPFLATLALAAIFAAVFHPLYRSFNKQFGKREGLAALATLLVALVCIVIPLAFLGIRLFAEAESVYASLAAGSGVALLEAVMHALAQLIDRFVPGTPDLSASIAPSLSGYAQQVAGWIIARVGPLFSSILNLFLHLFIFFAALYYFLKDGDRLRDAIVEHSPLDAAETSAIFDRLTVAIRSVVRGSLTIAFIQGVLATIGFSIFGIPNAVLWGMLTFVAALVPGIGTSVVIVPAVLYLLITGHTVAALGMLAWGATAVGTIDNILSPTLVGRGMKMHPFLVFLSVIGGIAFYGPAGIFLGPLTTSFALAVLSLYAVPAKG